MTTVLLVDDEPLVLKSLAIQLRRRRPSWTCATANSGEAALEAMTKATYDVIVSDMRMPGMNGPELLERVRERAPQIARIVLSGEAADAATERATAVAHEYLSKPLTGEDLIRAIERVAAARPA